MLTLKPKLKNTESQVIFYHHALKISSMLQDGEQNNIPDLYAFSGVHQCPPEDQRILPASMAVLSDLAQQKWKIICQGNEVSVLPPDDMISITEEKSRIRQQELVKRDEQLRSLSVVNFIKKMEQARAYNGRFVSIFNLMRDGGELKNNIEPLLSVQPDERVEHLPKIIDPYLQFVTCSQRCEFTGLRLMDIWRYFRYTWSNQYTSIPGRTMMMLVRDRAVPFHPIIGIAAIGSPIVQIRERDTWIGWDSTTFIDSIRANPSSEVGQWIKKTVASALSEIYVDDFLEEGILSRNDLAKPKQELLKRLREDGIQQRKFHHRYVRARDEKSSQYNRMKTSGVSDWETRARTHLFRSKRALALSELLQAQATIDHYLSDNNPSAEEVTNLLSSRRGRDAVSKVLRKAKADRVGIAMADITVCGAVQPYNGLLGGKLVAMLATSPQVVAEYRRRYQKAESEIASSMAGRSIIRTANLVFLGTTSLYGVGSSQYNRVSIPAPVIGGSEKKSISYIRLGRSRAFGTSQFSSSTISCLVDVIHATTEGQRVNSIFGEGVSPKLRKVRQGLDEIGFPSERLLCHGRERIIYGVPLVKNLQSYLLGMSNDPEYLYTLEGEDATKAISRWWQKRWLCNRISVPHVLDIVGKHTLERPITHGARVKVPDRDEEVQESYD